MRILPLCSRRVSEEALVGAAESGLRFIANAEANLTHACSSLRQNIPREGQPVPRCGNVKGGGQPEP